MDLDIAKTFVEKHSEHFVLMDPERYWLSASKNAIKNFGYKSLKQIKKYSFLDIPVKACKLAKAIEQTNKDVVTGDPCVKVLIYWCLKDNRKSLMLGEKVPIKNKMGEVIAILSHGIDITQYNLVDIARYLKLAEQDKYSVNNDGQFFYKLHKNNNHEQNNLSNRELQCLFYMIRGYTSKDTGKILDLSFRTVESYIETTKYKFNCSSKAALIEKSIMQGYINILPESLLSLPHII